MGERGRAEDVNEEGIKLAQGKDFDQALAKFEEAAALDPSFARAHGNMGNVLLEKGEPGRAAQCYDAALALEPGHIESLWGRMNARRANRDFAGAQADLEAFRGRGGPASLGVAELAGQLSEELKLLRRLAEFKPPGGVMPPSGMMEETSELLDKALEAFASGDEAASLIAFDAAISLQPEQPRLFANRAAVHLKARRLDKAAADCLRAIGLDAREALAYTNRAGVLKLLGDLEGAERDWDSAMKLGVDEAAAYIQRGWVRKERGRFPEALMDFDAALAAQPSLPEALYAKGIVLNAMGRMADARGFYDAALEADPRLTDAYAARGLLRAALDGPRHGVADLEKYMELGDGKALTSDQAYSYLEAMRRG